MLSFSQQWLTRRERFDRAARDRAWPLFVPPIQARALACDRIIDLGCGTGSNLRYLTNRLLPLLKITPAQWLLVDADAQLLEVARNRTLANPPDAGAVQSVRADLRDLEAWPVFAPGDFVSASALIDLVSDRWLAALIERCLQAKASVHLALSYDGRTRWCPVDSLDDQVLNAFHLDQRQDKGFGWALGPDAPRTTIKLLKAAGYAVWSAASDWQLDARRRPARQLIRTLIADHARIAVQRFPGAAEAVGYWAEKRERQTKTGRLRVQIGHIDILALPPD